MNIKARNHARISIVESINLLRMIKQNPRKTYGQLSAEMGISESTVKRMFKRLEYAGVDIKNIGSRRVPYYRIQSLGFFSEDTITKDEGDAVEIGKEAKSVTGEFNDA